MKEEITKKLENISYGAITKITAFQKVWNIAKEVLRRKFTPLNTYIRKERKIKNEFSTLRTKKDTKESK